VRLAQPFQQRPSIITLLAKDNLTTQQRLEKEHCPLGCNIKAAFCRRSESMTCAMAEDTQLKEHNCANLTRLHIEYLVGYNSTSTFSSIKDSLTGDVLFDEENDTTMHPTKELLLNAEPSVPQSQTLKGCYVCPFLL